MATGLGKSVVIATLPELLVLRGGRRPADRRAPRRADRAARRQVSGREPRAPSSASRRPISALRPHVRSSSRPCRRCRGRGSRVLGALRPARLASSSSTRHTTRRRRRIARSSRRSSRDRPDALVFGFTATPNRGDGVRLIDVFHKIVFSMDARGRDRRGLSRPRAQSTASRRRPIWTRSPRASATS